MDACQRRHLRSLVGIRWPDRISNESLYALTKVRPLSERIPALRWRMLGHVLRLDGASPAQRSMDFVFGNVVKNMKARRGRHSTNLASVIAQDVRQRGLKLTCKRDLDNLRRIAADKRAWKDLMNARTDWLQDLFCGLSRYSYFYYYSYYYTTVLLIIRV